MNSTPFVRQFDILSNEWGAVKNAAIMPTNRYVVMLVVLSGLVPPGVVRKIVCRLRLNEVSRK